MAATHDRRSVSRRSEPPVPDPAMPERPLLGLRVVDMGFFTAGPLAGRMLTDLGADVVKVEPVGGEPTRRIGGQMGHGSSYLFYANNAGKRSIALDTREPHDLAVLQELVGAADVLLANFPIDSMRARGLGPEDCRARNPTLVYCTVSGYGSTGPYASERALDMCLQARSGIMSLTGSLDDHGPTKVGVSIVDDLAATAATTGIVAALVERDRTGRGQLVDVSLLDVAIWATQYRWPGAEGTVPDGLGNTDPCGGVENVYRTHDGHLAVAVRWQDVAAAEELLRDEAGDVRASPRRDEAAGGHDRLARGLQSWAAERSTADAERALAARGIPCCAVSSIGQVARHPHTVARSLLTRPPGAEAAVMNSPFVFDGSRSMATGPAPDCDADRGAILQEWLGREADTR